eukprot:SAG31_NODE_303_length_18065_cov_5.733107_22_plen_138_part_00
MIEGKCLGSTGACGAMYTASTMASSFEAMGMALPGSSSHQAVKERAVQPGPGEITDVKIQDCKDSVKALFAMMRAGTRSREIMTMKAFEVASRLNPEFLAPFCFCNASSLSGDSNSLRFNHTLKPLLLGHFCRMRSL